MNDVSVLKQALPYIRHHKGRIFLVKLGGNLVQDADAVRSLASDVALLHHVGIRVVLVHGGGPQATDLSRRLGLTPEIVEGRRVTDEQTLEVAKMVFAGKISIEILSALRRERLRAIGLSGVAGDLIRARRREVQVLRDPETGEEREVDWGHVGDILSVDTSVLRTLLDAETIPVVSSLGGDDEGNVYNINADTVAAALALDLGAHKIITLTDVPGLLRDPDDRGSVVSVLTCREAESALAAGEIRGGMAPKIKTLVEAVRGGVSRAHVIDGFEPHTLLLEVFTRRGRGTMIVRRTDPDTEAPS
jgi:acetylglutamate kinase